MITQNNIMNLIFSKGDPSTVVGNTIDEYTDLSDKQAAILNEQNVVVNTLAATTRFRIVYRTNNKLVYSPFITTANVIDASAKTKADAVEQVDYIGYNGTSGSLDVADDTDYIIRLYMTPNDTVYGNKLMVKFGAYRTGSGATQLNIARYLHDNLVKNFQREPIRYIKMERIYSGAAATALGDLTVSYGSKVIKSASDDTANILVGSIVRINGTGAGTTPCYTVVSHDGGAGAARLYTLDVAYQGATAAAVTAAETCATGGNWGLKLTGVARSDFKEGWFKYQQTTWETQIQGFTATTVTHSATASKGIGTYQEVAELEWFLQGNEGSVERVGIPAPTSRKDAETGATLETAVYNIIRFKYTDDKASNGILGSSNKATSELIIFVYSDGSVATLLSYLAGATVGSLAGLTFS